MKNIEFIERWDWEKVCDWEINGKERWLCFQQEAWENKHGKNVWNKKIYSWKKGKKIYRGMKSIINLSTTRRTIASSPKKYKTIITIRTESFREGIEIIHKVRKGLCQQKCWTKGEIWLGQKSVYRQNVDPKKVSTFCTDESRINWISTEIRCTSTKLNHFFVISTEIWDVPTMR